MSGTDGGAQVLGMEQDNARLGHVLGLVGVSELTSKIMVIWLQHNPYTSWSPEQLLLPC